MIIIYTGNHEIDKILENEIKGSMVVSYSDFIIEDNKFENQTVAHHLAYIGSIKDDILDVLELACDFSDELKVIAPDGLKGRYGIDNLDKSAYEIIEEIASRRGFKLRADNLDVERASRTLIDDFRKGRLGKIMLEQC